MISHVDGGGKSRDLF